MCERALPRGRLLQARDEVDLRHDQGRGSLYRGRRDRDSRSNVSHPRTLDSRGADKSPEHAMMRSAGAAVTCVDLPAVSSDRSNISKRYCHLNDVSPHPRRARPRPRPHGSARADGDSSMPHCFRGKLVMATTIVIFSMPCVLQGCLPTRKMAMNADEIYERYEELAQSVGWMHRRCGACWRGWPLAIHARQRPRQPARHYHRTGKGQHVNAICFVTLPQGAP